MLSDRKLWADFLSGDGNSFKMIYERSIQNLFAHRRSFCSYPEKEELLFYDLKYLFPNIRDFDFSNALINSNIF